jgi:hypothetical protein
MLMAEKRQKSYGVKNWLAKANYLAASNFLKIEKQ